MAGLSTPTTARAAHQLLPQPGGHAGPHPVGRRLLPRLPRKAAATPRARALACVPRARWPPWWPSRRASDQRFIALIDAASAADLTASSRCRASDHVQREPLAHVVAHLVNHQVHHRGQAHAMLAGTAVAPPQLDEFLMSSEGHLRQADLAALGWTEAELFGR
jgi:hypothetical protein